MARRKTDDRESRGIGGYARSETLKAVASVGLLAVSAFLILSSLSLAGVVGKKVYGLLRLLVGAGYFLLPVVALASAAALIGGIRRKVRIGQWFGIGFLLISGLGFLELVDRGGAGIIGRAVLSPLLRMFDLYATSVILGAWLVISILLVFDVGITPTSFLQVWRMLTKKRGKRDELKIASDDETALEIENNGEVIEDEENTAHGETELGTGGNALTTQADTALPTQKDDFVVQARKPMRDVSYTPIPLSLLERDKGKPGVGDIKGNANMIKRTLLNFGIDVEMDEISIGPSVTRYALKPAEGVKLSKIVALQDNLSLALAAHPIRIEAPIPGKSLVGIEIPNSVKSTVGLASLLSAAEYQESDKPLLVALGKGISGKSHFANLSKMPHLLIAGATGSGKSVSIHALITSLLYRNPPDKLKLIMIDPKRVELTLYKRIPHLLSPVVTDPKRCIMALKWAAREMDRRYDILESESVRDIESYHKNILAQSEKSSKTARTDADEKSVETMPYIVIVIDELADIMSVYPRELESAIVRLAQMSRAVGIHLVLSTQRPSVNVITGLIKANIPSRIALQVTSQVDSRTILDSGGAEKLLGAGDLLFLSGEMSKPVRIQSPFISETEVKKVVKFLADHYDFEPLDEFALAADDKGDRSIGFGPEDDEDSDDLYEEAREVVMAAGKASTSYIQRKLRVGYARAARIMDVLEERGVIGPADGAKPRSVIGAPERDAEGPPEF